MSFGIDLRLAANIWAVANQLRHAGDPDPVIDEVVPAPVLAGLLTRPPVDEDVEATWGDLEWAEPAEPAEPAELAESLRRPAYDDDGCIASSGPLATVHPIRDSQSRRFG
jgi:hypothetical protein